jgi:hypothetical protein
VFTWLNETLRFYTHGGVERLYDPLVLNLSRHLPDLNIKNRSITMADRAGLKIVGFIFATVTLAVMLMTVQVVKSHADGRYTFDSTSDVVR